MKFQNPSIHHSKVNTHTDRHTDRQAESNMPFQLFQSWGHKKLSKPFPWSTSCKHIHEQNGPNYIIVKMGLTGVNIFFLFLIQDIDCGYSLEPAWPEGSNMYQYFEQIY